MENQNEPISDNLESSEQDSDTVNTKKRSMIFEQLFNRFKFRKFYFFSLLFLLCITLSRFIIENDTYWLVNTGKYILSHGFPTTEPFTMHTGLEFSIQQWLTSVIFYFLFNLGGDFLLAIFDLCIYMLICVTLYKISMILSSNNRLVSYYISIFACLYLSLFIAPRPQILSFLVFALEILVLELYINKHKVIYLICLIFLSIMLVNVHSAMWLFFFVLLIPYIIDSFRFKILFIKTQGYRKLPLIITFVLSFLAGFLNPYGLKNMFYTLYCYGNPKLNSYVLEMCSPDFKGKFGIFILILFVLVLLSYLLFKGSTRLRFALITLGTLYMGLSSVRSIGLFIILALPMLSYYLKELTWPASFSFNKKLIYVLTSLILICSIFYTIYSDYHVSIVNLYRPAGPVNFITKELDYKNNHENIRLYNNYNVGGFLEYCGIKTFIDSRAEVFLKSINKKDDIIIDYIAFQSGTIYYDDYIKNYDFTHLLLYRKELLSILLEHDNNYKKIFEDNLYTIFEVIKK